LEVILPVEGPKAKGGVAMPATREPPTFVNYRDAVTDLVDSGEPFGDVEDVIEESNLKEDTKAALWLLAFFEQQDKS
jgi:hypothetical protein